ncbi:hypothetical protein PPIS_a4266 [Pseudoalteromonas piscicida]|uniref:Uncharacterized protein n=1 Tax=Pseudoalteromonas piscicida TaxID=43662 RepID=A0ABM6NJ31_PSEO7|nr:hypothetical protein PPIS_a4266 [Pseudoalteromonas piscicida]
MFSFLSRDIKSLLRRYLVPVVWCLLCGSYFMQRGFHS